MILRAKKLFTAALAGLMSLGIMTADIQSTQAATRAELASINVGKNGKFQYWSKNAPAKLALVEYVRDVTNPRSKNFIPVEDRIAVFDVDGTLACETAPFCFDFMMFIHRALDDPNYRAAPEDRSNAQDVRAAIDAHKVTNDIRRKHCLSNANVFRGMTVDEYAKYTRNYLETPVEGFSNLKIGEIFYMPMVEVISYLHANQFKIVLVTGADRQYTRVISEIFPIDNVIGTDYQFVADDRGDKDGMDCYFTPDVKIVRGDFVSKNINMNKVNAMVRELGKQPVLAFGNSMGDSSMIFYTTVDNKYRTAAFMVLCDDLEREFGNQKKADEMRQKSERYGWTPISMRDDWTTIYGDKVQRRK